MAKIPEFSQSDLNPVGMVVHARLTEPQFQALNGTAWVLYDDRDITGSKLAGITGVNTLEDARGLVLRGKNNSRVDGDQNPDGDVALGTFQDHQQFSHNHGGGSHTHQQRANVFTGSGAGFASAPYAPNTTSSSPSAQSTNGPSTTVIGTDGGNENRMRNLTLNTFIKIN